MRVGKKIGLLLSLRPIEFLVALLSFPTYSMIVNFAGDQGSIVDYAVDNADSRGFAIIAAYLLIYFVGFLYWIITLVVCGLSSKWWLKGRYRLSTLGVSTFVIHFLITMHLFEWTFFGGPVLFMFAALIAVNWFVPFWLRSIFDDSTPDFA